MTDACRVARVETLHDGWGTLRRHTLGDGTSREVYDRGHAAACLATDPLRGLVLLVRQLRVPILVHEGDLPRAGELPRAGAGDPAPGASIEAPAGLIDDGESPEETMRREMEEETGFAVRDMRRIADLYASPGSLSERMILFTAIYGEGTRVGGGGGLAEEGESIEVIEVSLDAALGMVADGRIRDLKTAYLLLHAARERDEEVRNEEGRNEEERDGGTP